MLQKLKPLVKHTHYNNGIKQNCHKNVKLCVENKMIKLRQDMEEKERLQMNSNDKVKY